MRHPCRNIYSHRYSIWFSVMVTPCKSSDISFFSCQYIPPYCKRILLMADMQKGMGRQSKIAYIVYSCISYPFCLSRADGGILKYTLCLDWPCSLFFQQEVYGHPPIGYISNDVVSADSRHPAFHCIVRGYHHSIP